LIATRGKITLYVVACMNIKKTAHGPKLLNELV
jgi:hypothetical protein